MRNNIRRWLAPPVFPDDENKTRTARLLHVLLLTLASVIIVAATAEILLSGIETVLAATEIMGIIYLALWFIMRRGRVRLASVLTVSLFLISTTMILYFNGTIRTSITAFYIVCVVIAGLLLGNRGTVVTTVLSLLAIGGLLQAEIAGYMAGYKPEPPNMSQWVTYAGILAVITVLLNLFVRSLTEALAQARQSNLELEAARALLEKRVEERTHDLARRAHYLQVTAAIAREATSELELGGLITHVVNSISRQFGFYHAGIFLLDSAREWAELKAASSEGGQRLVARGHRLRVGQEGMVGYVAQHGEPRIALDTGKDAVFFDNPDLPQTRSEAALPLRARGLAIGVLDVQSTEPNAFTQEDVTVLQTLADQIATAIDNARLFQQVEEGIEAERRAYGELAGQAWSELIRVQTGLGFASNRDAPNVSPAGDVWTPQMQTALESGQIVSGQDAAAVAIPIKVRDRVIGVIDGRKRGGSGQWTHEELALIQTLAEQSAVALESARLYQDTQRRAAQEKLVGEVTARMRESLQVQTVLNTAAVQIRQALGLKNLVISLTAPETNDHTSG